MRGMVFLPEDQEQGGYAFSPAEILFEGEKIDKIRRLPDEELNKKERETFILPGLVDIHLHGCMGVDFCDSVEEKGDGVLPAMCEYEAHAGVTSTCLTTMTYDEDRLIKIMQKARDFSEGDHPLKNCMMGVHLEGPFISREKCGAQNPKYIHSPDPAMLQRLQEASGGLIRLVAIAPEKEGALSCIKQGDGFRFSIAHTTADYETALSAIRAGANHVTHMYNAMPQLLNRAPGVIGAAFDEKDTFVELIGDGIHVHPAIIRATFSMFGSERIVLISDSMEATGMPDGKYALGGQDVYKQGNLATLSDATIAGSVTDLFSCLKSVIAMGIPKEDAIRCATINPARSVGIDGLVGSLEEGKRADLLITDRSLNLQSVIASGRPL